MQGVGAFKIAQLSELRMVCQEVGSLSDARAMPLEYRKWWLKQMVSKDQGGQQGVVERDGKRFTTRDVK